MNNSQFFTGTNWKVAGNDILAGNFLGTLNAQDLIFKRTNIEGLRLTVGGALLATGDTLTGVAPATGAGNRMMWVPAKAAFRAGQCTGSDWNNANIGLYSFVIGSDGLVVGQSSGSLGFQNNIAGANSYSIGTSNISDGDNTIMVGTGNTSLGDNIIVLGDANALGSAGDNGMTIIGSNNTTVGGGTDTIVIGHNNTVSGAEGIAIGYHLSTFAEGMAMGRYASTNGQPGVLVIGDDSVASDVTATTSNQFVSRFLNGYYFKLTNSTVGLSISPAGVTRIPDLSSVENGPVHANSAGDLFIGLNPVLFAQTASRNVPATVTSVQSLWTTVPSIAAGVAPTGSILRVKIAGVYFGATFGSGVTIDVGITYAGVNVQTGAFAMPAGSPVTGGFAIEAELPVSITSDLNIDGFISIKEVGTGYRKVYDLITDFNNSTVINTATTNTLDVTVQYNMTDANASLEVHSATVELIKL